MYNRGVERLADRTAYITGGSSGIGLEIGRLLHSAGARVVLIARNQQTLSAARLRLLSDDSGGNQAPVYTLPLDVGDHESVARTLPEAVRRFGEPDLLFNCAGDAIAGYFDRTTNAELNFLMRVNVEGTWNTIQALLPWLRARRGRIVNVSSVAGLVGTFGYSAYAASKFAVIGLSEALRSELAPDGVGVSVLCPADTDTAQLARENLRKPAETAALSAGAGILDPVVVAAACIRAVHSGRFLILVGAESGLIHLLKRFAPRLLFYISDRIVRKQRRRKATVDIERGEQ